MVDKLELRECREALQYSYEEPLNPLPVDDRIRYINALVSGEEEDEVLIFEEWKERLPRISGYHSARKVSGLPRYICYLKMAPVNPSRKKRFL